jgi:salicylate hydroxylase
MIPATQLSSSLTRGAGTTWIGPLGHIVSYSLRHGELINFVGHIERDDWQVESWTELGTIEECAADFKGWHPDVQELIRNIDKPYKWALFLREPLQVWSQGRVSLLGDACHATLPYLAQGANMAIEDGLVLARCLEQTPTDLAGALVRYQNARRDRTTLIVERSAENVHRFHHPSLGDPTKAKEYVAKEWSATSVSDRYDWLFKYDALNTAI